MGLLNGGSGFDWNGNGDKDNFDDIVDMEIMEEIIQWGI